MIEHDFIFLTVLLHNFVSRYSVSSKSLLLPFVNLLVSYDAVLLEYIHPYI